MSQSEREWGFWSEVKLDALERYVERFTTASKTALSTLYLDLFAGSVSNRRRDSDRTFDGSTVRALNAVPPFDNLCFFELGKTAQALRWNLEQRYPNDCRYEVIIGDCNDKIGEVLSDLAQKRLDRAATFAFIDPDSLEVKWTTLSAIASFKHPQARYKAEMLILLSHTTVPRLAGWDAAKGLDESLSADVTAFFGSDIWKSIFRKRHDGQLTAPEARKLYTDFFRYRLEEVLGYERTLTIEMGNERGAPVYVLVFATDHPAGDRIMASIFKKAREQSAEYRADVAGRRGRQERESAGTPSLFDAVGEPLSEPRRFFESTQVIGSPILPNWLMKDSNNESGHD